MTSLRQPDQHVGLDREHGSAPQGGWVRRMPGMALLVVLVIVAAGVYVTGTAPTPVPAGAPAGDFSAERAFAHVERIAAVPHPAGSPANAAVRDYIIAELVELGLQPRVHAATTVRGNEVAQVENIHARIPGRASTGHVVAAAHYDSAPQAPGAADDAAGVAAILEVARALRAGPPLRNDVDLVITDAEEPGLLGARAFVTAGVLDPARSVVVNLEAGGSSGPSMLFQTSPGNADLVRAYGKAKDPAGGSELSALFDALPNDTDFTEFRDAGFAGLNLIFGDRHVHYHSPTDTAANLDRASLQHHGDNLLTLTRVFGEQQLPLSRSDNTTFFTVFDRLIWYPELLAVPFALLALGGFAATLWYARRHGFRLGGAAVAAATVPAMLAVVAGVGVGAWWALGRLRPEYRSLDWSATYRPEWYEAGLTVLAITVAVAWYLVVRRRLSSVQITLGVLAWLTGFAVTLAIVEPAAAYLFTWPALAGSAGLTLGLRLTYRHPAWPAVGGAVAALPAVMLWRPDYSLGLAWAAGPMTMIALLAATAVPAADQLLPRRSFTVPTIGIVTAVVLITVGFRVDVLDAQHPGQTSLAYALDADRGTAAWLSADPVLAPWTKHYVTEQHTNIGDTFPGPLGRARHSGPAPTWSIRPPEVTVTEARQDDDRRQIQLRITPGEARRVDVAAATAGRHIAASVQGLPVEGEPPKPPTRVWDWALTFEPIPPDAIDLTLTVEGSRPLPIRVLAYHDGLPPLPEFTPPPEDVTWSRRLPHATVVATTHHV